MANHAMFEPDASVVHTLLAELCRESESIRARRQNRLQVIPRSVTADGHESVLDVPHPGTHHEAIGRKVVRQREIGPGEGALTIDRGILAGSWAGSRATWEILITRYTFLSKWSFPSRFTEP